MELAICRIARGHLKIYVGLRGAQAPGEKEMAKVRRRRRGKLQAPCSRLHPSWVAENARKNQRPAARRRMGTTRTLSWVASKMWEDAVPDPNPENAGMIFAKG